MAQKQQWIEDLLGDVNSFRPFGGQSYRGGSFKCNVCGHSSRNKPCLSESLGDGTEEDEKSKDICLAPCLAYYLVLHPRDDHSAGQSRQAGRRRFRQAPLRSNPPQPPSSFPGPGPCVSYSSQSSP